MAKSSGNGPQFSLKVSGTNEIRQAVGRLPSAFESAALVGAKTWAANAESKMKQNKRWTDQTSNAKNGLFGDADFTGGQIVAVLGHSVEYGKYLELGFGGRYAVIMPTITAEAPSLQRYIDAATKGIGW